jgi:hypothetical protein
MEHRSRIAAILKQWQEMTRAETAAIQAGDWAALRKVQETKAQLRLPLGEAVEQWRSHNSSEAAANPFRDEVNQLLALETQNGNMIVARKHRAQEKKRLLEQALFNLRRVRSSYAISGHRPKLNSYS